MKIIILKFKFFSLLNKILIFIIIIIKTFFLFSKKKFISNNYQLSIFNSFGISIKTKNQNINMNNCLISIISSNGNGGAIYINTELSLIINDTTFYQCISTNGF